MFLQGKPIVTSFWKILLTPEKRNVCICLVDHEQSHSSGRTAKKWKIVGLGTGFQEVYQQETFKTYSRKSTGNRA